MGIGPKTDNGFENGGAAAIERKGPVLTREEIGIGLRRKRC